jgi:hypothetical protein
VDSTTNVIDPVIGAFDSVFLIFLVYAVWLVWSGSPIWKVRARPVGTSPVILLSDWFRISGGIYLVGFFLALLLGIPIISSFAYIISVIAYLVGLWKTLAPKVL